MNVFILGSGWLALPLQHRLSEHGHQVTVSCTTQSKCQHLKQAGHQAMVYLIGEPPPEAMLNADVVVLANTCKDITAYKDMMSSWPSRPKQHIIYTSTTGVYLDNGDVHDENSQALKTDHPTYQIEQVLRPRQATVVRLAGLVGPGRHPGRFFRKTGVIRNPQNPVNLIHLDDAMGLIGRLIEQPHPDQVFNGCTDNHPSKSEYYSHMAEQHNGTALDATQVTDNPGKTISNQSSKSLLEYRYQHPDVWQMPFE